MDISLRLNVATGDHILSFLWSETCWISLDSCWSQGVTAWCIQWPGACWSSQTCLSWPTRSSTLHIQRTHQLRVGCRRNILLSLLLECLQNSDNRQLRSWYDGDKLMERNDKCWPNQHSQQQDWQDWGSDDNIRKLGQVTCHTGQPSFRGPSQQCSQCKSWIKNIIPYHITKLTWIILLDIDI